MQYRGDNFLYGGIDFSLPGEGGLDCINFLSPVQRLAETVVFGAVSLLLTVFYWRRVSLVTDNNNQAGGRDGELRVSRQCLLLSLSLVFGLELGYKLSTGQLLWVLNPCHVLTVTQLVLLVSPRSDLSLSLFRLQMYWLTGPLLAILFPVTFTRHIAGEVVSYWVQHLLLLVVPAHLLSTGRYTTEHLTDTAWPGLSLAVFSSYHWIVLQPAGLLTGVNLNNMLCPAASDPFGNSYYRIIAMSYFVFLLPLVGKMYSVTVKYLIHNKTDAKSIEKIH